MCRRPFKELAGSVWVANLSHSSGLPDLEQTPNSFHTDGSAKCRRVIPKHIWASSIPAIRESNHAAHWAPGLRVGKNLRSWNDPAKNHPCHWWCPLKNDFGFIPNTQTQSFLLLLVETPFHFASSQSRRKDAASWEGSPTKIDQT